MALSRPYRAQPQTLHYPRALPWAIISRPFGAEEYLQVPEDCVQALISNHSVFTQVFITKFSDFTNCCPNVSPTPFITACGEMMFTSGVFWIVVAIPTGFRGN
jgi:hypothetical protein